MKHPADNGPITNLDSLRTEGDINLSLHRQQWQAEHLSSETLERLADDAEHFIHQAMSTPCLNVLRNEAPVVAQS